MPKLFDAYSRQRSVSTDTRKIKAGDIFFALKGDNFNGNKFAAQALEAGAAYAVIDEVEYLPEGDDRYFLVQDVLLALQDLARTYRRTFDIPVLAITGTNGKTTTKELMVAVLETERKVHGTSGNLNNHIGVPLTLLSMPPDTEIAVIEMGANKHGDIRELCEIAEPTIGMITNIGRAHLERFGDIEGVRQTKGEMFDFLRAHGGTGFVNQADHRVVSRAHGLPSMVTFGTPESDYAVLSTQMHYSGMAVTVSHPSSGKLLHLQANLIGTHNVQNILLATVCGLELGISEESIQRGISQYEPRMNRTQMAHTEHFSVLMDAYNANPSSMEATLQTVAELKADRPLLILGDMFEMGPEGPALHLEIIRLAHRLMPEGRVLGVGELMAEAIRATDFDGHVACVTLDDARAALPEAMKDVDFVLLKGSRGMALERLCPDLGIQL